MKLVHTVELDFFEDDANGEWGLAHTTTHNSDTSFNAFWNDIGIFHDVFEHWFENEHKYFMGSNAMNVGGEMAAMGAMWYYYSQLGVNNRFENNSFISPSETMKNITLDMVEEAIEYGYTEYGHILECGVPYQKPVYCGELEYQIKDFAEKVKGFSFNKSDEIDYSKDYKNSVSFNKIASLHRWGFKMAERLVNDNYENQSTLTEFLSFWKEFTENNNAEDVANHFKGITFKIYKEKGVISWKAVLIGEYDNRDYVINSNHLNYVPYLDDILMESYETEDF